MILDADYNGDGIIANGECVLDPAIEDGYSSSLYIDAIEVHVVQQESASAYCP